MVKLVHATALGGASAMRKFRNGLKLKINMRKCERIMCKRFL